MDRKDLFEGRAGEIIEEAKKKAKEISDDVAKKAQDVVDSTKKIAQAEKLDYMITRKYREIGKIVYSAYEETGSYDGVVDDICEEINNMFDQIIDLRLGEETGQILESLDDSDIDSEENKTE